VPIPLSDIVLVDVRRVLCALQALLDKAETHGETRGLGPSWFATLRLAPDMQPFGFQVESVVNNALGAAARLQRQEPPRIEGLATVSDMRRSIVDALARLDAVDPRTLEGAEALEIVLPSPKGARRFSGRDYVLQLALPNVQFHMAIAYALLRSAGVDVGKRDFLGKLPPRDPPPSPAVA
jgi:hypothetical protein